MSSSEFFDMYFLQDVFLPYDEYLLESMVKIDAPIVDFVFPRDVVPHQKPSFTSPIELDPTSSYLFGENFPISS